MPEWTPDLSVSDKPRYLAIADAIALDVRRGVLVVGDRLPPQRKLAHRLRVDFTTVARGYVEAQKRGIITSTVGQGTFVTSAPAEPRPKPDASVHLPGRVSQVDMAMNLPPEPSDPELLERMRAGAEAVAQDLVPLLRYQDFGGNVADKEAAASWLGRRALVPSQERVMVVPGAHAAMLGILSILTKPGDVVLCESITYPGIRSIAAKLGVLLTGLPMDGDGIDPQALAAACAKLSPKLLYLNPTLHNPTTLTVPQRRREEIVAVARRWKVPILEDDAYGFIPVHGPAPFAAIAPDITWHVAGLAKCIGAGLRAAYVVAPDLKLTWPLAAALKAFNVMASPITVALATRWIEDGTADAILKFIRQEARARQEIVAEALPPATYRSDPISFNIWLQLPEGWTRSAFIDQMRSSGVGIVASDAFTVGDEPSEAVRVCLGGPADRNAVRRAMGLMSHALAEPFHGSQGYGLGRV